MLGPTALARAKLRWAAVWLPARRRLLGARGRPLALALETRGGRVRMRVRGPADLAAIGEVLVDELYDVRGLGDVRTILDLGSHIGSSIAFFRARHPHASIHGLEPDPRSFALLEANVGGLEGVTVDPRAIGGEDGEAELYAAENSLASSLVSPAGRGHAVRVRTVSLDRLIEELGLERVDLLKLDVEGAEYDVLAGARRLDAVQTIVGELHPQLVPCSPEAFFALLEDFEVRIDRFSAASWQFQARRV